MWRRSASFVLEKYQLPSSPMESPKSPQSPNPNPIPNLNSTHGISAYYQTRAEHHGVVTSDWLAQAQAAVEPPSPPSERTSPGSGKPFSVIEEFNYWRKKPDLAEAVAAIMALAAVIRSSNGSTMMELEIELKTASDALKVIVFAFIFYPMDCFGL